MSGIVLSPDELLDLTGFRQPAKQRAWLDERRIPYRCEGGRILASRITVERWLCGVDVPKSRGPNLAAVS